MRTGRKREGEREKTGEEAWTWMAAELELNWPAFLTLFLTACRGPAKPRCAVITLGTRKVEVGE